MAVRFDTSKLEKSLRELSAMEKIAEPALFRVGADILEDSQDKIPKPPVDTGHLRRSFAIVVNGNFAIRGPESDDAKAESPNNAVRISFNTEYAARLHDETDWTPVDKQKTPGEAAKAGPFWVKAKLDAFSERYLKNFGKYLMNEIAKNVT